MLTTLFGVEVSVVALSEMSARDRARLTPRDAGALAVPKDIVANLQARRISFDEAEQLIKRRLVRGMDADNRVADESKALRNAYRSR